jgi:hypothetical protein
MSTSRASWPFLLIASKNIFSEGYTQFPEACAPVSTSAFAEAPWSTGHPSGGPADRGIVLMTRFVSRLVLGRCCCCCDEGVSCVEVEDEDVDQEEGR